MNPLQIPTRAVSVNDFNLSAQDMLLRYSVTHGLGYTVTVRLNPGVPDDQAQTDVIPGWMHGLITHLTAMEDARNTAAAAAQPDDDNIPNVFTLQRNLNDHHGLLVPQDVILALIFEYARMPRDLQVAWRTRTIPLPPLHMINDRWRAVQDHGGVDPRDVEGQRLEQQRRQVLWGFGVGAAQEVSPPSRDREALRARLGRPSDYAAQRDQNQNQNQNQNTVTPPARHERNDAFRWVAPPPAQPPQAPAPVRPTQSSNDDQVGAADDDSGIDRSSSVRQPGGRLRNLGRRVSYRLTPPRARRTTVTATTPAQPVEDPRRSASPRGADDQPPAVPRLRSPFVGRSNTVSGATLTRRLSDRIRNIGNSFLGRRDGGRDSQLPPRRLRSPSHDRFIDPAFQAPDRDQDISDILADVGLNTSYRQPGRGLILEDRNLRIFVPNTRNDNSVQPDGPLFGDDDDHDNGSIQNSPILATGDYFLNLQGQQTISIDDVDLNQFTNPLAAPQPNTNPNPNPNPDARVIARRSYIINGPPAVAAMPSSLPPPAPAPVLSSQSQDTPGRRRSTRVQQRPLPQQDTQVPQNPALLQQPARRVRSTTTAPPNRQNPLQAPAPQQPAAAPVRRASRNVHVGPNGITLPTTSKIPGHQVTLYPNANPQQVAYFKSIWRPGQHVPDTIPGHCFTCPVPGCPARTGYKRDLGAHLRRGHNRTVTPNDMNQRLPVPARRRNNVQNARLWVLTDDQGNDLPGEGDNAGIGDGSG